MDADVLSESSYATGSSSTMSDPNELSLTFKRKFDGLNSPDSILECLDLQPTLQPHLHSDQTGRVEDFEIPSTDYYLYDTDNGNWGLENDYPVARCIIESGTKFFIERNLYAHLHATYEPTYNSFQDEDIDLESLAVKPPTFAIFGKSGVGVTTLAWKLVEKLKSVLISPDTAKAYYLENYIPPEANVLREEIGKDTPTPKVLSLIHWRIRELDVLHKGYVMDGVPLVLATDMSVEEQMQLMYKFPIKPRFLILMHMQDIDLYRRRSSQKFDSQTGIVYTRNHFINAKVSSSDAKRRSTRADEFDDDDEEDAVREKRRKSRNRSRVKDDDSSNSEVFSIASGDAGNNNQDFRDDESDTDFEAVPASVLERLYTRDEDNPNKIQYDFDSFRKNMHHLEKFIQSCDRRKVLELNAYFTPSVLLKRVLEFTDSFGVAPAPIPIKLVNEVRQPTMLHHQLEEQGELTDSEGPFEEQPCEEPEEEKYVAETDWEAVLRGSTVRGRVDPRFRWRISRWKNLCPVALKYGRSIAGKPELAVGFMDKVYFMSSESAIVEFQHNPRPFLLPKMPSSPVKFYVVGHPLAGKSMLAEHLAKRTDGYVIDMEREVRKRMHLVKFDYLFRTRLESVLEMTKKLNDEYYGDWKRQERARRLEILKWIEDFIRRKADEVLNTSLKLEKAEQIKQRDANLAAAMKHELQEPFSGACQSDQGAGFTWTQFVQQIHEGKRFWTHQEKLELAWDLFRAGKLKYKVSRAAMLKLMRFRQGRESAAGSEINGEGASSEDAELSGEEGGGGSDEEKKKSKKGKKKRRRPRCKPVVKTAETEEEEDDYSVRVDSKASSVFGADEETDESIKMRYPEIPPALIFSIPRPADVTDKHPQVEEYVLVKMCEAEKWAGGNPPELYAEVLRRAVKEVESKYVEQNFLGPLSGGWVVENLEVDIEKWRACLRHPEIAPDNVIGMLDHTPDNSNILLRLKKNFRSDKHSHQLESFLQEVGEAGDFHEFQGEHHGEGGDNFPSHFPFITKPPEKSSTALLMERLPKDDLKGSFQTDQSQKTGHERDRDRQISLADSLNDITADTRTLLEDWFKQFDADKEPQISEKSTTPENPYTQPKPEMEEWIKRHVNYEMLTSVTIFERGMSSGDDQTVTATAISEPKSELSGGQPDQNPTRPIVSPFPADFPHPIPSFLEIGGEDHFAKTPSGLLSEPDVVCPEDLPLGPEDPPPTPCVPKIHGESPKRRFLRMVSAFNEFWNMAIPVMHEQKIKYWEMGVVDDDTVLESVHKVWDELESRFVVPPNKVEESELNEETEEWEEANELWGMGGRLKTNYDEFGGEVLEEDEVESETEEENEGEEEPNKIKDKLAKLEHRPDEYLKAAETINQRRMYGDLKDYCPVALQEFGILRKGFPKYAAKYRDRMYFMASEDCRTRFLEDPGKYLPGNKPLVPPPARICITGSPGCGQEEIATQMAEEYRIYLINFRERLQELIRVKVGTKVGPDAFDFNIRGDSLLGLKESNSSFDLPSLALLEAAASMSKADNSELDGEGAEYEAYLLSQAKQKEFELMQVKKLGVTQTASLAMCPINDVDRTEKIADRDWTKMSRIENAIKDFLELGVQLPDFVLDEYIAPLWQEEPFKCKGFILVGFPNSDLDMQYMVERNFIPEYVYVVECKEKAMRNRLLIKSVNDWHAKHPPKAKAPPKKKEIETQQEHRKHSQQYKEGHAFQLNLTPKVKADEKEAVNYKDEIAHRVSSLLYSYHQLYSKHLKSLKMSMNKNRINWMPIQADLSLREAKLKLKEQITIALKYRESIFESTYVLSQMEAGVLIDRGFYRLSKFGRWCPVEIKKGNMAVNLWNAPGVEKIPILYRNYLYFLAGEENAKLFRENVWEYVTQECPTETMPLYVIIIGPPKSGKTSLANKLAHKLGLIHIKQDQILHDVLKHSFIHSMINNYNMNLDKASLGPQSMKMADEILGYLRRGHKVPQYMSYRALDLALMAPRAQFHGVVFDDFPLEDVQLQELLERGIVPTVVVNLNMGLKEAYRRAEIDRFDGSYNYEDFTEECENFIDYLNEDYGPMTAPCLHWYETELQCLLNLDACESPSAIYKAVQARCFFGMNNMQRYIYCGLTGKPAVLEGTGPLTSLLESRLSFAFRKYDPVALNDHNELIKVEDVSELSLKRVVEYKQEIYVFAKEKNVEMFLKNPDKYTHPHCLRVPPKNLPGAFSLTEDEMNSVEDHWGFQDFDPVFYHEGNFQYKWLKRGQSKYCAEYKNRLYFFISADNLEKFMRKPQEYSSIKLPSKLPARVAPQPLDPLSPSGFLIASGLAQDIIHLLAIMAKKRPRFPFMSLARSGVLFMGYYLKTLNMKSTTELRTHYRRAMTHMLNVQSNAEKAAHEIDQNHGRKSIPHSTKKKMQILLNLSLKRDIDNVVDPFIPNLPFSYEEAADPEHSIFKEILIELQKEQKTATTATTAEGESEGYEGEEEGEGTGEELEEEEMEEILRDKPQSPYLNKEDFFEDE